MPFPLLILDENGLILDCNDTGIEICGAISADQLISCSMANLFRDTESSIDERFENHLPEKYRKNVNGRLFRLDGKELFVQMIISPLDGSSSNRLVTLLERNEPDLEKVSLLRAYQNQKELNQKLGEILEKGRTFSLYLNLDKVMNQVVRVVGETLGFGLVGLYMKDQQNGGMRVATFLDTSIDITTLSTSNPGMDWDLLMLVTHNPNDLKKIGGKRVSVGFGIDMTRAGEGKKPDLHENGSGEVWKLEDDLIALVQLEGSVTGGFLRVSQPLQKNDRFIDVSGGIPGSDFFYHQALWIFANQAAIAIENARGYSETKHRLKQIGLINELTQSMLESKQMGDIFLELPQKIISVFDANSLMITKWDTEKGIASQIATFGEGILPNTPKTSKAGNLSITEQVLKQKSVLVISTKEEYALWENILAPIFSDQIFLILPMINQDNLLGAILIGFKGSRQISQADISIGEYVALQIAAIIHKSDIYEKAKIQSTQFQHANDLIASLSFVATSILCAKGLEDIVQTMGDGLEKMNIHSLLFFHEPNSSYLNLDYCSRNKEISEQLKAMDYPLKEKINLLITDTDEFRNTLDHQQIVFIDDPLHLLKSIIPAELGPFIGKFQDALAIYPETKSLLMPLIVERKTIGLLCLYGKDLQEIDLKAGEIFNS
ncbi:MAG TPA: PAS domain-containing protein, partial [Leptolinea sp.]